MQRVRGLSAVLRVESLCTPRCLYGVLGKVIVVANARITIFDQVARGEARQLARPELVKIAGQISGDASGFAPRRTGMYAGSFTVDSSEGVRVVSSDTTAIHKEYGTSDTPAHAALTEAAMRYGKYSGTRPRGRKR